MQLACLEEQANMTECLSLPVKTCRDILIVVRGKTANNSEFVPSRVYQQENCIYIEAETKNLIKAADRLLFGLYGVM